MKQSLLAILVLFCSIQPTVAQPDNWTFDYHPEIGDAISTVETEDELWIVFRHFILQVDKADNTTIQHDYQSLNLPFDSEGRIPTFTGSWQRQNGDILIFSGSYWYLQYHEGKLSVVDEGFFF